MKDLMKLKRERQSLVGSMRELLNVAETRDSKVLTAEEETRYAGMDAELERRSAEIQREERLQDLEAQTAKPVEEVDKRDFKDFGEFLQEVRFNPNSGRLHTRTTTMGDGPQVGYMVPQQFDFTLRAVTPQEAIIRPRATIIPAGDPPDSKISLVALDQSDTKGVYSGVKVKWVNELGPRLNAGDPYVRQIELEPNEVSGWINVSDKLLRNSAAAGELVARLLRQAIIAAEEHAFISGDGVGKPLGFLGHSSSVQITRNTTGQITYDDIVNMYARVMRGNHVWLGNRTILTTLMHMKDSAGNQIWQPNARDGAPSTLLGLPLFENERQPVLGTSGDLMLVDLSYYAIKDGSAMSIFIDPYTQKENATTRIYAWWNVDGGPLLNTPIMLEDGESTVSPFVSLT